MGFGYPIVLDVSGRRAVVIGPERMVGAKAEQLRRAGAEVASFAPGGWRPEDLSGAAVCVAWSEDARERDAIARESRARGVLVNVIDDVPNCDFAAPALVRRGDLAIAVSTAGRSPTLARLLREELQDRIGPEWERVLDVVADLRARTIELLPNVGERARRWHEALDLEEAAALVREGRQEELRERLLRRLLTGEAVA
jgi:precorrin-2 dehydrogenase/sirohydrochlorin ferrochelatase